MVNTNVREAVEDSGLKQKFIAEKMGISEQALSAMMNGKQKIGADDFFVLADVLRMTPVQLYSYKREQKGA